MAPGSSEQHPRAALTKSPEQRGSALCCPRAPTHPSSPANSWPPSMPSVHTAQKGSPDAPGQWVLIDTSQAGPGRGRGGPQPAACAPHPHSRRSWRRCTQLSFRSWSGTQLSTNTHACAHTHAYTHMYTLTCVYPCAQSCPTHTPVCTPHMGLPEGHGSSLQVSI